MNVYQIREHGEDYLWVAGTMHQALAVSEQAFVEESADLSAGEVLAPQEEREIRTRYREQVVESCTLIGSIAQKHLRLEEIARVAHEVNRAACRAFGDDSQPPWDDAPQWQRASAIDGVEFHLRDPDAGPEASHENWMATKRAEGWTYGEIKDPEAKTHPCMVPFEQLPRDQQLKDWLFRAVVHALHRGIARV